MADGELDLATIPGTDEYLDTGSDDYAAGAPGLAEGADANAKPADAAPETADGDGATGDGGTGDGTAVETHMIPKQRLDQEIARRRQAEQSMGETRERLARLEGAQDATQRRTEEPPFDFAQSSKEKWEAIGAGKVEEAQQIEARENAARQTISEQQIEQYRREVQYTATRDARAQVAQQAVYDRFPQLDQSHADYSPEAFEFAARYIRGASADLEYDVANAIQEGAVFAAMKFGFGDTAAAASEAGGLVGAAGASAAANAAADRNANAQNKANAAGRQAPNLNRLGTGDGTAEVTSITDLIKMRDTDIAALEKSGKWQDLRGDNFGSP